MKKILITILLTITLGSIPSLCFAQETKSPPIIPPGAGELIIPHTTVTAGQTEEQTLIGTILPNATKVVIALAGSLAFLFIIIGGIEILTAYGDDEKLGNAKKTITFAIVGLIIALLSYAIVSIISSINLPK